MNILNLPAVLWYRYIKLINIIFDTEIIPESWSFGSIKPVYKNKGDPKFAENYRPILFLSCFRKLFTLIINNILNKYATEHETIDSCQAGFRKGFSTADNYLLFKVSSILWRIVIKYFILASSILSRPLTTYGELDFGKSDINGNCLILIRNIHVYNNIKSNVC